MSPDVLAVIVRAFSFALLFQAVGAAFFTALFNAQLNVTGVGIRRLAGRAAMIGMVLIVVHLALEPTRMTGEYTDFMDPSMRSMAWTSSSAVSQAMQVVGLMLVTIAMITSKQRVTLGVIGALCALTAFLFTGHTSTHPWRIVLAPLLAIHLFIVAFWFGSLLPLWIVSKYEPLERADSIFRKFSSIATGLVPVIAIVGLAMTASIAHGVPPLREPYGELILAKLVGFSTLMLFAAWNKWRLVPAIAGNAPASLGVLRRSMIVEFALLIGVLSVTAVMTTFFSPNE